mgnify:CR=1 FL=1
MNHQMQKKDLKYVLYPSHTHYSVIQILLGIRAALLYMKKLNHY